MLSTKQKRELKINQRRVLFNSVEVGITSPQQILRWGQRQLPNGSVVGEVKNSKTLNYKKFTPLRDGLFCERIFGPTTSWECACGKKRSLPSITFCNFCEVEYKSKYTRRHQLGYIQLNSPVAHIWFLKARPSYLSLFLGKQKKTVFDLVYCNTYLFEQAFSNVNARLNIAVRKEHGVEGNFKGIKRFTPPYKQSPILNHFGMSNWQVKELNSSANLNRLQVTGTEFREQLEDSEISVEFQKDLFEKLLSSRFTLPFLEKDNSQAQDTQSEDTAVKTKANIEQNKTTQNLTPSQVTRKLGASSFLPSEHSLSEHISGQTEAEGFDKDSQIGIPVRGFDLNNVKAAKLTQASLGSRKKQKTAISQFFSRVLAEIVSIHKTDSVWTSTLESHIFNLALRPQPNTDVFLGNQNISFTGVDSGSKDRSMVYRAMHSWVSKKQLPKPLLLQEAFCFKESSFHLSPKLLEHIEQQQNFSLKDISTLSADRNTLPTITNTRQFALKSPISSNLINANLEYDRPNVEILVEDDSGSLVTVVPKHPPTGGVTLDQRKQFNSEVSNRGKFKNDQSESIGVNKVQNAQLQSIPTPDTSVQKSMTLRPLIFDSLISKSKQPFKGRYLKYFRGREEQQLIDSVKRGHLFGRKQSFNILADTPEGGTSSYIRAHTLPFLPSMVSERIERDLLLEVFNSFPLDEDLPIPLYCKQKRWYPLRDVHDFMAQHLLSDFDQPKNKDELTRASIRKFKEQATFNLIKESQSVANRTQADSSKTETNVSFYPSKEITSLKERNESENSSFTGEKAKSDLRAPELGMPTSFETNQSKADVNKKSKVAVVKLDEKLFDDYPVSLRGSLIRVFAKSFSPSKTTYSSVALKKAGFTGLDYAHINQQNELSLGISLKQIRSTSLPGPPLLTPSQGGSGGKEVSGGPDQSLISSTLVKQTAKPSEARADEDLPFYANDTKELNNYDSLLFPISKLLLLVDLNSVQAALHQISFTHKKFRRSLNLVDKSELYSDLKYLKRAEAEQSSGNRNGVGPKGLPEQSSGYYPTLNMIQVPDEQSWPKRASGKLNSTQLFDAASKETANSNQIKTSTQNNINSCVKRLVNTVYNSFLNSLDCDLDSQEEKDCQIPQLVTHSTLSLFLKAPNLNYVQVATQTNNASIFGRSTLPVVNEHIFTTQASIYKRDVINLQVQFSNKRSQLLLGKYSLSQNGDLHTTHSFTIRARALPDYWGRDSSLSAKLKTDQKNHYVKTAANLNSVQVTGTESAGPRTPPAGGLVGGLGTGFRNLNIVQVATNPSELGSRHFSLRENSRKIINLQLESSEQSSDSYAEEAPQGIVHIFLHPKNTFMCFETLKGEPLFSLTARRIINTLHAKRRKAKQKANNKFIAITPFSDTAAKLMAKKLAKHLLSRGIKRVIAVCKSTTREERFQGAINGLQEGGLRTIFRKSKGGSKEIIWTYTTKQQLIKKYLSNDILQLMDYIRDLEPEQSSGNRNLNRVQVTGTTFRNGVGRTPLLTPPQGGSGVKNGLLDRFELKSTLYLDKDIMQLSERYQKYRDTAQKRFNDLFLNDLLTRNTYTAKELISIPFLDSMQGNPNLEAETEQGSGNRNVVPEEDSNNRNLNRFQVTGTLSGKRSYVSGNLPRRGGSEKSLISKPGDALNPNSTQRPSFQRWSDKDQVKNTKRKGKNKETEGVSPLERATIHEILSYTGGGGLQRLLERFDPELLSILLLADINLFRALYKRKVLILRNEPDRCEPVPGAGNLPHRLEKRNFTEICHRIYLNGRRLKLAQLFTRTKRRPEWMMISNLPVLPPDLRPILQMSDTLIVASDLNNLYQRVIYRNNRYEKLRFIDFNFVTSIQRLVQDAVDRLIENGKAGSKPFCSPSGRPLKSLSDILKGKKGRFRLNLLGKRVDFSGRSVIVVSPTLKLHECGIPREIALELYQYFLIRHMVLRKQASNLGHAKKLIQRRDSAMWNLLREVIYQHPVLLNRAPTLHRLGIQAFQPRMVLGSAIRLHPLVCSGFNADFDGDQMGIHLPICFEARAEAWNLLWSRNNILSPATGQAVLVPTQDMVLGFYYMTALLPTRNRWPFVGDLDSNRNEAQLNSTASGPRISPVGGGYPTGGVTHLSSWPQDISAKRGFAEQFGYYRRIFFTSLEVIRAFQKGYLEIHSPVWLKCVGKLENEGEGESPLELRINTFGRSTFIFSRYKREKDKNILLSNLYTRTTVGRVLVNDIISSAKLNRNRVPVT